MYEHRISLPPSSSLRAQYRAVGVRMFAFCHASFGSKAFQCVNCIYSPCSILRVATNPLVLSSENKITSTMATAIFQYIIRFTSVVKNHQNELVSTLPHSLPLSLKGELFLTPSLFLIHSLVMSLFSFLISLFGCAHTRPNR